MSEPASNQAVQTAFVTGVSRGLGLEIARQLLDAGATVYACSRGEPDALRGYDAFHFVAADLGDPGSQETVRGFLGEVKSIDLAILNAGLLGEIRDLGETPLDDMKKVFEVNVWANKWIVDVLFERERQVGQVVGISSGAAVSAYRGWGGYCLSKAGLNLLIALQAQEHPGAHFSAVAPGLIDTAMQDYLCSLPEDPRYGPVERLKEARRSGSMPTAEQAAARLLELLPEFRHTPSGTFLDVRQFG